MIAICVMLVATALFAFLSQQTAAELEIEIQSAKADAVAANASADVSFDKMSELSAVVGFSGESSAGHASPQTVQLALEEMQGTFPGASDSATLESAGTAAIGDYNQVVRQARDLKSQVTQLQNDLRSRQTAHSSSLGDKERTISTLRSDMDDLRSSMSAANVDLEGQRDGLRDQVRDLDRQVSELRLRLENQDRSYTEDARVANQRRDILAQRLAAVARRAETQDGTILSANMRIGKAWIDLGRMDRVQPGMEFEVSSPLTGDLKGRIRVSSVEDNRAECVILSLADKYDPMIQDDPIANAVFDPTRQPVAVLLGDGFGSFSREDMRIKLSEVGIRIADEISNEADYLILGTPFFDEETGDVVPWDSLDSYKLAQSMSVTVLPFRDTMSWLGL